MQSSTVLCSLQLWAMLHLVVVPSALVSFEDDTEQISSVSLQWLCKVSKIYLSIRLSSDLHLSVTTQNTLSGTKTEVAKSRKSHPVKKGANRQCPSCDTNLEGNSWHGGTLAVPALGGLRQEEQEFEASLGYITKCLKKLRPGYLSKWKALA